MTLLNECLIYKDERTMLLVLIDSCNCLFVSGRAQKTRFCFLFVQNSSPHPVVPFFPSEPLAADAMIPSGSFEVTSDPHTLDHLFPKGHFDGS